MTPARKILLVAIGAEVILISTGLFLAFSQGVSSFETHQNLSLAASAAGFPLLLAVMELFKIPAGWALYRAKWAIKPFALVILIGGMIATFETVTMAGSTWFRSIQYEVTVAQSELAAMKDRSSAIGTDTATDEIKEAIEILDEQIAVVQAGSSAVVSAQATVDDLTREFERLSERMGQTRKQFGQDWDTQTANNTERMKTGDERVAEQARASQRSLPSRSSYVDQKMAAWQDQEGKLVVDEMQRLEGERKAALENVADVRSKESGVLDAQLADLNEDRSQLQQDLNSAIDDARLAITEQRDLSHDIEKQTLFVAKLAKDSMIYDLAAKVYAVPIHEVSEEQANRITGLVILGVGFATAMTTGLAAFISAHLEAEKRSSAHVRALRLIERRDAKIRQLEAQLKIKPKVKTEIRDRLVYRYLPIDRDLQTAPEVTPLRALNEDMRNAA